MKEEESLIQKAGKGDGNAFGTLYDAYMPRIYRFVFLKTGRKQDAEDITHQVFLSAWQNIGKYESKGFPFSSWLYRIASNAVIDHYRTKREHRNIETVPEEIIAETPDLEGRIDTAFELELVKTALSQLEEDQQNILLMKFVDELSNKEIAEALGKNEGTVRVIQHRALKQLKKHVDAKRPQDTTKEI